MGVGGQCHAMVALPPGERSGTRSKAGWVGPRAGGLENVNKISSPPGFNPQTIQAIASCFTDWAIPAPTNHLFITVNVCPENSTRWLASCLAVINAVLYEYYQRSKTVYRLCTDWMVQEKKEHTKHRTLSKTGFNFRIHSITNTKNVISILWS